MHLRSIAFVCVQVAQVRADYLLPVNLAITRAFPWWIRWRRAIRSINLTLIATNIGLVLVILLRLLLQYIPCLQPHIYTIPYLLYKFIASWMSFGVVWERRKNI